MITVPLKPGDVVVLSSDRREDAIEMTVEYVKGDKASCVFRDPITKELKREQFLMETLRRLRHK